MRKIPNSRPNVSRLSQEVTSELPGRQYATVFTVQPQLSFVVPVTNDLLCKTRLTCPARVQRKIQNTDVSKPSEHVICMYLYVGIRLCRNARVCRSAGGRRGDYAHLEAVLLRVNCLKKNQNAQSESCLGGWRCKDPSEEVDRRRRGWTAYRKISRPSARSRARAKDGSGSHSELLSRMDGTG